MACRWWMLSPCVDLGLLTEAAGEPSPLRDGAALGVRRRVTIDSRRAAARVALSGRPRAALLQR